MSTKVKSNSKSSDGENYPPSSGNKVAVTGSHGEVSNSSKSTDIVPKGRIGTNLYSYIQDTVDNGIRTPSLTAGRPKQEFDTSPDRLLKFYEDYVNSLQYLIEKNFCKKRSDTFRNTIFSYLKKLPIKLRELCCSVSEPKSKKMEVYLDAFLAPFIT